MRERRKDRERRQILEVLNDPVLILFARDEKDPKEIRQALAKNGTILSVWQIRKRIRSFNRNFSL
jgi:hypothetical protein